MIDPFSSWAQLSDALVQAAILVLGLALLAYATDLAARRGLLGRATGARARPVPAVVGGAASEVSPTPAAESPRATGHIASGPAPRAGRTGNALTVLGVVLVVAAVAARGVAAGRAPWGNMYEFAITGAASAGVAYLVFLSRQPVRDLGVWVVGLVLLTLGLAVTVLYTPVDDLVPVLESYWLVVHVAAAIIAGGLFTVGFVATCADLAGSWRHRASPKNPGRDGAAARVSRAAVLVAFPIWTFAVMAGAIWAENAWGRYWGWDPKETWAFVTWVLYAAYLHATATAGWRGTRASLLALAGYLAFLFNFFGVNMWIPGLHSYAGV